MSDRTIPEPNRHQREAAQQIVASIVDSTECFEDERRLSAEVIAQLRAEVDWLRAIVHKNPNGGSEND